MLAFHCGRAAIYGRVSVRNDRGFSPGVEIRVCEAGSLTRPPGEARLLLSAVVPTINPHLEDPSDNNRRHDYPITRTFSRSAALRSSSSKDASGKFRRNANSRYAASYNVS